MRPQSISPNVNARFVLAPFLLCLPVALAVGYLLATPESFLSLAGVGLVLGALCVPLLLRWHYPLLLFSWNAALIVFFLPGRPNLWMLMAVTSLFLTVLAWVLRENVDTTGKAIRFQHVPALTWTLLAILLVVVVTAKLRGGIGLRSLGGAAYGGRNYVYILFAVIGYFALSSRRIPPRQAVWFVGLFFLGALTHPLSNLIYVAGPNFYWLYNFFSVETAISQVTADTSLARIAGASAAGTGAFCFLLARYGLRGLFNLYRPWRLLALVAIVAVSLLGGFRSVLALFFLLFVVQFYFEGLFRTALFPILTMVAVLGILALLPVVSKLPFTAQRALSFLPIELDSTARADAAASTEWRLRMWRVVWPEVPKYLLLGKGYHINPTDLYLATESAQRGLGEDIDQPIVAGDYHSGPLSLLVPFGAFGTLAFLAFCCAALRVLWLNHRHGDPALRLLNVFLLSAFVARFIFYWAVFGAFASDLAIFAGLAGLSVAINGGVCNAPASTLPEVASSAAGS